MSQKKHQQHSITCTEHQKSIAEIEEIESINEHRLQMPLVLFSLKMVHARIQYELERNSVNQTFQFIIKSLYSENV